MTKNSVIVHSQQQQQQQQQKEVWTKDFDSHHQFSR